MSTPCSNLKTYNLSVEQGATLQSQITITLNGAPVDLTGSSFQFTAKLDPDDADDAPTTVQIDWAETVTSLSGITMLVIPAATTAAMQAVDYVYQLRMVSPTEVVTPLFSGVLTVVQPVSSRSA